MLWAIEGGEGNRNVRWLLLYESVKRPSGTPLTFLCTHLPSLPVSPITSRREIYEFLKVTVIVIAEK